VAERQAEIEDHPYRGDRVMRALHALGAALLRRRAPFRIPALGVDRTAESYIDSLK
jgi:hypothetical protein